MIVYPVKSRLIQPGDSLLESFSEAVSRSRVVLREKDIIAVSSKVVAISEGATRDLTSIKATPKAKKMAEKYSLSPPFAQVVLEESDQVIGGVKGALLTIKDGDAIANAGVDRKNAPGNSVVLWPHNPDSSARILRRSIHRRFHKNVGVVIIDSRVTPLRLGTIGLAIGCAGFEPVRDYRGTKDLFGRQAEITLQALADGVASTCQLVMGETLERTPFALVRGAPVSFTEGKSIQSAKLSRSNCLYMSQIR